MDVQLVFKMDIALELCWRRKKVDLIKGTRMNDGSPVIAASFLSDDVRSTEVPTNKRYLRPESLGGLIAMLRYLKLRYLTLDH